MNALQKIQRELIKALVLGTFGAVFGFVIGLWLRSDCCR